MTIVAVDVVATNAAIIAILLMSCACFGCPPVWMGVKVTLGIMCSSQVIRGDRRGCAGSTSFVGTWLGMRWMAGTYPGVFRRVCLQCVRIVLIRFRFAIGSRACMMAGLSVTL